MVNVMVNLNETANYHKRAIRVLESCVCRENRVIRLHNRVCECRRRVDAELELALLAIVCGESLEDKGAETRTCPTTEGVEDKEALKPSAVVSQTSNSVHHIVDLLLSDCIVTPCI
jgi:hypothetical protein